MAELVGLIREWRLGGFASVVPIPEYKAVFPGAKTYDPYSLALKHTLINMAHIGNEVKDQIKCSFEDGDTSVESHRIYNAMKAVELWGNRSYLGGISFESKNLVPLQAADLMAREAFKHMDNQGIRPYGDPWRDCSPKSVFTYGPRKR